MLKILTLLLALALLAACTRAAPPPEPCYTLVLTCDDGRLPPILVSDHWTEMRPPSLELLCYVKCAGGRACVSTDGCTWLRMR